MATERVAGCYNLECSPGFVQKSSHWLLGGLFINSGCPADGCYSVDGGTQYYFTTEYYFYLGNWWLNLNGEWVGYYPATPPNSVYQEYNNDVQTTTNGPLATSASEIDYGGETFARPTAATVWPSMGSGEFAEADLGWTHAAFERNIYFYSSTTTAKVAHLEPRMPSPTCYTIVNSNDSGVAGWNTYFFFGGTPPGAGCPLAPAIVSSTN
jgi:Neprosin